MDAAWHDMQMTFGIPKSEYQVKYTSPNIIMLDESDKSRGFGGKRRNLLETTLPGLHHLKKLTVYRENMSELGDLDILDLDLDDNLDGNESLDDDIEIIEPQGEEAEKGVEQVDGWGEVENEISNQDEHHGEK
uniref:Uncharacterized protein n=1 Tax=Plectus sambesii TaxID=2011161 RepID=A0A914W5B6_9BILA